jgi:hypothetical protein
MKRLCSLLFLWPVAILFASAAAQSKQQTFLQLSDPSGQMIRGTSTNRGYERQIITTNFSGVTTGNAQVQFSMPAGAASATLATLQSSKKSLPFALFTITQYAEQGLNVLYTLRLEEVSIIKTEDVNGNTNVTLKATRIGTTYFEYDRKKGTRTVSGKTGFDFATGQPWNSF